MSEALSNRQASEPLASEAAFTHLPLTQPAKGQSAGSIRQVLVHDSIYRRSLALSDVVSAIAALLLGVSAVGGRSLAWPAVFIPLGIVLFAKIAGLYDRDNLVLRRSTLDEVPTVFQLATVMALAVWLADGLFVNGSLSHVAAATTWILFFLFASGGRAVTRATVRRISSTERCMLIGGEDLWSRLDGSLRARSEAELVSHFPLRTVDGGRHEPLGTQLLASRSRLEGALRRDGIHRVIIAVDADQADDILDGVLLLRGLGMKVSVVPHMPEVLGSAGELEDLDGLAILGVRSFGLSHSSKLIKRAFDLASSAIILLLISPLLLAISIAVAVSSPGPILFRQPRVGRNGKVFEIFKFRTMFRDADDLRSELAHLNETEGLFKIGNDPRATRVGALLRRTSLDELPQLINVLWGEMSLVGPRPLVPEEDRMVQGWARRRLDLTPGMTGHWQILGSTRVPLQEMVKIDYLYVANWSLWGDIKALLRTLPHVVGRRGL